MSENFQDGILKLCSVISYAEYETTLKDALLRTLPNVSDAIVYILSQDGRDLVSSTGLLHTIPREGILGETLNKRQRLELQGLDPSDPVCGLIKTVPAKRKRVISSPVIDGDSDQVIAVLLAVCDEPSKEDLANLTFLEKQTVVCCKRLKRTAQLSVPQKDGGHLNNNDSILKLCADLYDQDAARLQVKVLSYLMEQTHTQTGFILLIDPAHREMFCQVIGRQILTEEIRFPLNDSCFSQAVERKVPIQLADIQKEKQSKLEAILGCRLLSLLCVPILRQTDSEVMALACLVNKHASGFSSVDVDVVQYCFKYTASVLQSTLAVQSERKLKNQTQALLQVAKNLFTHLGKCLLSYSRQPALTVSKTVDPSLTHPSQLSPDSVPSPPACSHSAPLNKQPSSEGNTLIVPTIGMKSHNQHEAVSAFDQSQDRGVEGSESVPAGLSDQVALSPTDKGTLGQPSRKAASFPDASVKADGVGEDADGKGEDSCESYHTTCDSVTQLHFGLGGESLHHLAESFIMATKRASGALPTVSDTTQFRVLIENPETKESHTLSYRASPTPSFQSPADHAQSLKDGPSMQKTASTIDYHVIVSGCKKIGPTVTQFPVADRPCPSLDDLTVLLREIMQEARNLTKAERCSVFLVERETQELVAKVFDGDVQEKELQTEVRIPITEGIAGHVASSGEILNIDDAYSHPLFYRGVDESTGFKTRNILCFPIKDENNQVIGVAQLCNKMNAAGFTSFDVEVAQAFSVYCCISIIHSLLYKTVREAQHRSNLSNELMTYHMQVDPMNVRKFSRAVIPPPSGIDVNFDSFCFSPRYMPYDDTPLAVLTMFEDMGFISKYRIRRETVVRFVLMVRRGYRDPPYHNWTHAFAVAHFCYLMHKNVNLHKYIEELDLFSLFVACLCHDLDHRGTTNSYQLASDSVLAALYSSQGSVLERHHFAQTMCILNSEGCNIFENLNREDYEKALDLVRDIILATDLASHLKIIPELEDLAKNGYNKANPHHKSLLVCLLMTSSDLSDQTKNWRTIKSVAALIYQEFFSQGDKERELGHKPMAMMDRDNACIPELQIGFLDGIALPVFRLLSQLFPSIKPQILDVVLHNKQNWIKMNEKANEMKLKNNSFDVLELRLSGEEENRTETDA